MWFDDIFSQQPVAAYFALFCILTNMLEAAASAIIVALLFLQPQLLRLLKLSVLPLPCRTVLVPVKK